ncbi:hypothetical protein B6S08_18090 [Oceanimonas doudoroffii]|uniref:Uncharacterized protein n=1 Tax=Oceanimonas doudoroffii TaxID=84158 RepID=A0A233RAB2_9GAMM|nr:hypothetical protein B6S08_18090 [Oceanimonas doudoroffii]
MMKLLKIFSHHYSVSYTKGQPLFTTTCSCNIPWRMMMMQRLFNGTRVEFAKNQGGVFLINIYWSKSCFWMNSVIVGTFYLWQFIHIFF